MDRDTAIEKIKKCLQLSRSANEHEAAAALRQAHKLMAEHNVDEATLSLADVREVKVRAASKAAPQWEVSLAHTCADTFACEMFLLDEHDLSPSGGLVKQCFYVFVGLDGPAELAGYAFHVLQRQCVKARLDHIKRQPRNCSQITKIARGDLFAQGWVLAVERLVSEFAGEHKPVPLVLTYMESKRPNMRNVKPARRHIGRNVRGDHILGMREGSRAKLQQAVAGRAKQEQLT